MFIIIRYKKLNLKYNWTGYKIIKVKNFPYSEANHTKYQIIEVYTNKILYVYL